MPLKAVEAEASVETMSPELSTARTSQHKEEQQQEEVRLLGSEGADNQSVFKRPLMSSVALFAVAGSTATLALVTWLAVAGRHSLRAHAPVRNASGEIGWTSDGCATFVALPETHARPSGTLCSAAFPHLCKPMFPVSHSTACQEATSALGFALKREHPDEAMIPPGSGWTVSPQHGKGCFLQSDPAGKLIAPAGRRLKHPVHAATDGHGGNWVREVCSACRPEVLSRSLSVVGHHAADLRHGPNGCKYVLVGQRTHVSKEARHFVVGQGTHESKEAKHVLVGQGAHESKEAMHAFVAQDTHARKEAKLTAGKRDAQEFVAAILAAGAAGASGKAVKHEVSTATFVAAIED